ncbi:uncharacterized protein PV06_10591 [Exophiala oligosperma]|uniref:Uncharacterized protein n=1 Tax=Exophiala oligosperma TaxID=215243 RepID=A0A0D2DN93_9EURO|nr:uncharacterized protein PV06_10591 [Exophiala oligosperma]KIW37249.1 hypothetical protein PV06_10591 [Exophiala oligosperma]
MASRPLLLTLLPAVTRSGGLLTTTVPLRAASRLSKRFIHSSLLRPVAAAPAGTSSSNTINVPPPSASAVDQSRQVSSDPYDEAKNAAFLGEADSDDGFEAGRLERGDTDEAVDPAIARNAAFLGEADSNDGFEARRAEEGDTYPGIDPSAARNAAFLGEADSDDGFEARRAEEGDSHEAMDATNAAFLGEADSDDGFEADIEVNPAKHHHKIEDTSESGFHAERGELR